MSALSSLFPAFGAAAVWHAGELARQSDAVLASGHAVLDSQLPGGGWPVGAVAEILQAQSGQNEWRLLLPALRRTAPGPVVLVGAPHVPFGPGLCAQGFDAQRLLWINTAAPAARLWAAEQALRCAEVAAVLAWLPQVRAEQLRRLQMAANVHSKLLFVMRPAQAKAESSPAALRVLVSSQPLGADAPPDTLQLHILKRRGPPLTHALALPARSARLGALLALSGGDGEGRNKEGGDALDRLAAAA